jgi:hypothetical protein
VTAVASVVTPTVVPIVVPTALMHQNTAIATAATALASSMRGAKRLFIIPLTLPFFPHISAFFEQAVCETIGWIPPRRITGRRSAIPCALSLAMSLGKDHVGSLPRQKLIGEPKHPGGTKPSISNTAVFAKAKIGLDAGVFRKVPWFDSRAQLAAQTTIDLNRRGRADRLPFQP